jgi:LysR family transcriptional activator of glutamate synthase operon
MDSFDRQIRYFLKIAEVRSLSRAAEDLDCTQPGLSRQLAALEAHLGRALFSRTGRGMDLTDAGRQLLEAVGPAFASIDGALRALRAQDELRGALRLASVHTLSYYFIGEVMAKFSQQYGMVSLSVMGRSSPDVVELVESGKADVG